MLFRYIAEGQLLLIARQVKSLGPTESVADKLRVLFYSALFDYLLTFY